MGKRKIKTFENIWEDSFQDVLPLNRFLKEQQCWKHENDLFEQIYKHIKLLQGS